jgi:hypothetical protein
VVREERDLGVVVQLAGKHSETADNRKNQMKNTKAVVKYDV